MADETKKPSAPAQTQTQAQKPTNPLTSVQTSSPQTQNRNFELNTVKKDSPKSGQ